MSSIRDISQIYNSANKKITGKISFKVGDKFAAKILSSSEDGKGIVLRTVDGWQFPAILEDVIGLLPEALVKFQVLGYDNGEIKLKLVPKEEGDNTKAEESLLEIAKDNGLEEEDLELLKTMTRFSIPLERENISKVKSLVDFLNKIKKDPDQIEDFIFKYLKSNQINPQSKEGVEIANILRSFFEEFKEMPLEEILLFMENEIELTEDNIKSFKEIFAKDQGLKNSLKTITNSINSFLQETSNKSIVDSNGFYQEELLGNEDLSKEFLQIYYKEAEMDVEINENYKDSSIKTTNNQLDFESSDIGKKLLANGFDDKLTDLIMKELPERLKESQGRAKIIIKEEVVDKVVETMKETIEVKGKLEGKEILDVIKHKLQNSPELKAMLPEKEIEDIFHRLKDKKDLNELINVKRNSDTANKVMEQVKEKLEELKSLVKTIIDTKSEIDSKSWSGILNNVKANINDIKLFNTISGEYYYMDIPIKFKEDDYPCKLIIKDDRKKGKRIDSNNVKMAVTISTVKMGKIDIYLDIKDRNMKLDFKCEEQWVKILDLAKAKLYKVLEDSNYNVSINVSEREKEMNIANCREFFQDTYNSNINVVV